MNDPISTSSSSNKPALSAPDERSSTHPVAGQAGSGSSLHSFTRLVIGGVEVGLEELVQQLQVWEAEAAVLRKSDATAANDEGPDAPSSQQQIYYALVGFLFEAQDRIAAGVKQTSRVQRLLGRLTRPFFRTLSAARNNPLLAPAVSGYDALVTRGQQESSRWIARGRHEDTQSRKLVETAFDDSIDRFLEYLTANPEVQSLVQQQSTGLANEVIEEVRERTVSADTFLEGLARALMGRLPRTPQSGNLRLPAPGSSTVQSNQNRKS